MHNRFGGGSRRLALAVVLILAAGCSRSVVVASPGGGAPPQQISINDGESLIRAMYARYQNSWYHTMTFIQTTTVMHPSQPPTTQTWYESLSLPGKLRIDIGHPNQGTGVLFRSDSTYSFSSGAQTRADTGWNPLLVLGFDVYTQPPDQTISILRHLGFQLSRFHSQSFDGRAGYVVGATSLTDSTSKQFWVERDKLVFVRMREKRANGTNQDIWFRNYVKAGNAWVAKEVWQLTNGQVTLREDYANIVADPAIDPALFDPKQWSTAKHWAK